ncbi:hypothetical protein KZO01_06030 [Kurthia zopfii]|uniref:Telomeric repeat-binding factor 2 n=1 Tax=Kurthia zopfii TaxID=1650 RepID=A0A8B4Q894_9BACL|nr:DUF4352 domain-containing protein [Kurthia zopfii]PWI23527.1 hypothetical protein DF281_03000 [Kurthia zopfii]TDR35555.1 uncharacterized protein DUF4352 [Kurthia zopfii]GEK30294.1 hypothetical protein KZO01_06030 [Kurthia zopfii]STX09183.1 Telomeric repeat-binding factor 2 [Kurthia zopfii]
MKKLLLSLPITAALLLGACGETAVEKVEKSDAPAAAEQPKKDEAKKDEVFKVGDVVKINDIEYKIKSATLGNGSQYIEPKSGKVLTLSIEVHNKSESKTFVSSGEFNLYKGDDQAESYFGSGDKTLMGDLNKGKKTTGVVEFDVAGPGTYELIYTPSFSLDNKEVKWNIKVK